MPPGKAVMLRALQWLHGPDAAPLHNVVRGLQLRKPSSTSGILSVKRHANDVIDYQVQPGLQERCRI